MRWLKIGLSIGLVLLIAAPAAAKGPALQLDKIEHASASFAMAGAGYALGRLAVRSRAAGLTLGLLGALVIGAAKEGVDANGTGDPSGFDFLADVVGATAGVAVGFAIDFGVSAIKARRAKISLDRRTNNPYK